MENQNSVCFIAKITEISDIEGADKIVQAKVNGWNSIVSKGQHQVGDLVLCITTDAVIPQDLVDKWNIGTYLRSGNRVRTVKLKGVYSECILIPWEPRSLKNPQYEEGEDLQHELGIYKYEPPVKQVQLASGKKIRYHENPNFHVYYKFPNYKNVPGMFTEEDEVVVTRKIHGTNARYGIVKKKKLSFWDKIKSWFSNDSWINYEFVVGSHNVEKGSDSQGYYDTNVWFEIEKKYNLKERLWNHVKSTYTKDELGSGFVVYGEIYGPGIQKHYDYNLSSIKFAAFDITVNSEYLDDSRFYGKCIFELQLNTVQSLYIGKYKDELLTKWNQDKIENTDIPHEGVVIKHISGDRKKIAKVVSPEFLIFSEKFNGSDNH